MKMQYKNIIAEITVGHRKGETEPAEAIVCDCGNDTFHVYGLARLPTHPHFQCAICSLTVCDGICDDA